jgi:6-phosphogluconolactonase/glucosamine-6-phosphate isomerase/deaminase
VEIVVAPDASTVADVVARRIGRRLNDAVRRRGAATIAFSGGSTPKPMLAVLASLDVPWSAVTAYQVDERVAPDSHPDRNLGLLDVLPLRRGGVKPMPVTAVDLAGAARRYARSLPDRLDVMHLGLGGDAHTASWPPDDPVVDSTRPVEVVGPFNGRLRMTLTPVAVAAARWRVMEVVGADKAQAVARWLLCDPTAPVQHVRRTDTLVVLDAGAASRLG